MKFCALLLLPIFSSLVHSQHFTERIRASDEPQLVSYRVLEGVTEPFESQGGDVAPAWKIMKDSADQKAAKHLIQQALHEYGQLLKNPLLFGAVPMEDRYDVFISMSKLLKTMGFYQKAEVLLYEAMSYSKKPSEAHFQLSLLYLEKEDLYRAKMHLKNCLYYQESDVSILVYLSTILIAEGKHHEAKFYLTRILSNLETKLYKLSSILLGVPNADTSEQEVSAQDTNEVHPPIDHSHFLNTVEDLMFRVFHGEYVLSPLGTTEAYTFFTNLLHWLSDGEMMGRFIFDLGQALYERGRPEIGMVMMTRGFSTSDIIAEGAVSLAVTELRLALEYPVIPRSSGHIVEAYLNITSYLATTQTTYAAIDLENIMDLYWSLPLLHFSGLPVTPIVQELIQRFHTPPPVYDEASMHWLVYRTSKNKCYDNSTGLAALAKKAKAFAKKPPVREDGDNRISIGILAGHMNAHPVGYALLLRVLNIDRERFRITLIALPLAPDDITKRIASLCDHIVNLPVSTQAASTILRSLRLDILLMPDWFPFPDSQGLYQMTRRIAPVQICLFVRGSSCGTNEIDYYLLSEDMSASHVLEMQGSLPPWREHWSEQVVLLDWPMLTPSVVAEALRLVSVTTAASGGSKKRPSLSVAPGEDRFNILPFVPLETEGQIFFDNQPVALLPLYPGYMHPLMDEILFRLLRSVSNLQIIIALPASFSAQSEGQQPLQDSEEVVRDMSIEWAKRLVRRYWLRVGSALHNRIRLLPYPLSDMRLVQLMRQADMMLDSFPIGAPLQTLALALSVGTPIVTLDCGTQLSTPRDELFDMKHHFSTSSMHHSNPMYKHLTSRFDSDIPWRRSLSPLPAYYRRIGVDDLIANSTDNYAAIAERIVTDKEMAYELRIRILDATDAGVERPKSKFLKTADVSFDDDTLHDFERLGRGQNA